MGCVFLEMAAILNDRTLEEMEDFYGNNGTKSKAFYMNGEATSRWIDELATNSEDFESLSWIRAMLQPIPSARPSASQVLANIVDAQSEKRFFCFRCYEAEVEDETQEMHSRHSSGTDLVTGSMLQTIKQHEHAAEQGDDTVTAQFLEEVGAVTIASDGRSSPVDDADELSVDEEEEDGNTSVEDSAADTTSPEDKGDLGSIPQPTATTTTTATRERKPSDSDVSKPVQAPHKVKSADKELSKTSELPRPALKPARTASEETSRTGKQVTFSVTPSAASTGSPPEKAHITERFSGLHADRRPLPSEPQKTTTAIDDQPIIAPDPLRPPPLNLKNCYPLPKATLVPSYILAGSNRFSMKEVRESDPTMGGFNLFVYGRLMFPSTLRGFAVRSLEGVYSPMHQRRLIPSSKDWSKADTSIKRAAEVMTPARLKEFDVWRPSGHDFAAIQESSRTSAILANRERRRLGSVSPAPAGEVTGFLILGLTEEALRYCDLVFCSDADKLQRARATSGEKEKQNDQVTAGYVPDPLLERRRVTVDIQLGSGQIRSVSAHTYIWNQGIDRLWHPWRPDAFVRGPQLQEMSKIETLSWRDEETLLADTMKIGYALVGDELCAAIMTNNAQKLQELLEHYENVDARCRKYGTPLQAAIAQGKEDMTRLLLDYGANPNQCGGKYGTPLIAATIGSRKSITRLLLKKRANVFATDKQHVNALYQAVGHGDWAITEMLLEAGAWLSHDYGEIKDLAAEKRDTDLQALLREYDIRDGKLAQLEAGDKPSLISGANKGKDMTFINNSSHIAKVVLKKFLVLASEPGSWRGRKGVAVTRAALAAGAPLKILDHIRDSLDPVSKLIDLLKEADKRHEDAASRDTPQMGTVEELGSDEEDEPNAKAFVRGLMQPSKDNNSLSPHSRQRASSSRSSSTSTKSARSRSPDDRPRKVSLGLSPPSPRSPSKTIDAPISPNHSPRIQISTSPSTARKTSAARSPISPIPKLNEPTHHPNDPKHTPQRSPSKTSSLNPHLLVSCPSPPRLSQTIPS
jgi:hypothetical protein